MAPQQTHRRLEEDEDEEEVDSNSDHHQFNMDAYFAEREGRFLLNRRRSSLLKQRRSFSSHKPVYDTNNHLDDSGGGVEYAVLLPDSFALVD